MSVRCSIFSLISFIAITATSAVTYSQTCPVNIDFENGSFSNWTCLTGYVQANGTQNIITLTPSGGSVTNQHTIISKANSAGVTDYYGGFPIVCPNGSGYSIKLGNNTGGHEAEGVAYEFTIPANRNTYSLVYNYAVVFENPNHQIYQQPRLEIEVENVTDNTTIGCSSFTFIPFGSPLPGFYVSPVADSVQCKDWTPVTINLNNNAGKTIRLTFKTADCTFNRHFGYAYIDVNTDCSGQFSGAAYCTDDTAVNVVGPYGFQGYEWYNQNFSQLLGTQQILTLKPPPPSGTILAVKITPYNGYGCIDTMYATMEDTLHLQANAGADVLQCNLNNGSTIGEPPKQGVVYLWSPPGGLSAVNIANPIANPATTTQYVLNINNSGGGCKSSDTVLVRKSITDTSLLLVGKNEFCITSADSAVLYVNAGNTVQWFTNNTSINGATQLKYRVPQSGVYYARLTNSDGCIANTRKETITIEIPAPGITYPIRYALINDPITLSARNFNGSVLWSPPLYLNNTSSYKPLFNSPDIVLQQYRIDIISKAGCATTDYQQVKTIKEIKIYVPNAFTPNQDGLNDYLRPIAYGATIDVFKVFSRWGQQVFSLGNDEKGWDGMFKGLPQESATYVWYLKATGVNNKPYARKGTVTLIR